jgi:hypothetical protein
VLGLRYIFGYNRFEDVQKELIIIIKASLLPQVYARKDMEVGKKSARTTLEQRLQQYRFKESPEDVDNLDNNNSLQNKSGNESELQQKDPHNIKRTTPALNVEPVVNDLRNGIVQNVQNDLVLINWEAGFNPTGLVYQMATIVRQNGKGYEQVGKVQIMRVQAQRTVGRLIAALGEDQAPIKSGDKAVIKW